MGKFAVIAKGARRGKGAAAGSAIEPPALLEAIVHVKPGRSVQILGQVSVIQGYASLKKDMISSGYAAVVLESINRAFLDDEGNTAAFEAALEALSDLDSGDTDRRIILWTYQIALIRAVGFGIDAFTCPVCGLGEARLGNRNQLWLDRGAICCTGCRPEGGSSRSISGESVRILRHLTGANGHLLTRIKPSKSARTELTSALSEFLKFHHPGMGRLPALEMLSQIENV